MTDDPHNDDALLTRIERALLESDVPTEFIFKAAEAVASEVDPLINERAGEALAEVLVYRLGKSPMGAAIRRHLLQDDEPLRDAATKIGCSAAALCKAESKLRKWLTLEE